MGDAGRITEDEVERAKRQWEEHREQAAALRNPSSPQSLNYNLSRRSQLREHHEREESHSRAAYEMIRADFDRQEARERADREEQIMRRVARIEAPKTHGSPNMNDAIRRREAIRLSLLRRMYERAEAQTNVGMDVPSLLEDIGVEHQEGMAAVRWLVEEGLAGHLGQRLKIEHAGLREAEQSLSEPGEATDHFKVPIIQMVNNFHGAIGAFQTGTDAVANVQQQNNAAPAPELVRLFAELRAKAAELPADERADASELVDDLEEQSKRAKPNAKKVDMLAAGLSAVQTLGPTVATIVSTILANH